MSPIMSPIMKMKSALDRRQFLRPAPGNPGRRRSVTPL